MSSPLGLVTEFWAEWGFRITVLSSLAAYLLLGLLSGTRRRSASGWRWWLQRLVALILWSAYWVSDRATTSALGKLSLSGSDASDGEHQLVSFWAPFLLLHLGGPDSITAYALEDNKLSRRKAVDVIAPLVGVLYLILSYYPCDGRLFVASMIIFFLGAAKCAERAYAQWRANLDKKHDEEEDDDDEEDESLEDDVDSLIQELMGADGDQPDNSSSNGEALLLLAQQLFRGWRRALVDSSVEPSSSSVERASQKIFSLGSDGTRAVVEMELSLMYEYLFTKAILAQIVPKLYYSIRFISPFATAAAGSFFWHWLHAAGDGRRSLCIIRGSFIAITYLLLATAFVVDVVWLLRALGSTWTYAFLKAWSPSSSSCAWLHHHVLCAGRWRCLHRAAMYYLDPLWRFSTAPDPISYRRWSGVIGRYNLLHECTATARRGACSSFCHRLATKFGLEEARYLCELPPEVSKLVFERVQQILPTTPKSKNDPHHPAGADDTYSMAAITTSWGQEALEKAKAARLFPGIPDGELPKFGKEFEQDVLAWHIATSVFLSRAKVGKVAKSSSSTHGGHVLAIEAMSEYLMFLVAQRRQMLPGLVLDKLCKGRITRRSLPPSCDARG
ncbi:hypothetical protein BS78_07G033800 [Paspalum vaginatum]|nr:hypothetical protein BS78_07G033800 [Paspalum vaginatum]